MKCPPASPHEPERLVALSKYGLGRNRPLPSLDAVVRIAARMFDVPVAAVNMIGNDHVFFAAAIGIDMAAVDTSRDASFCAHAILQSEVMIVPDASLDLRFHDNPLVTGSTHVRFYAGVPILSADGLPLGALCIIDPAPNYQFSTDDAERLRELARMATDRLELRRIEIASEVDPIDGTEPEAISPTAMIRFDQYGRIIGWNASAATLYRYDLDDWRWLTVRTLAPERDRDALHSLIAQAVEKGTVDGITMPSHVHGLRSDGTEFLLGFSLFCWYENGTLTFNAHLQDLTPLSDERESLRRFTNEDVLTGAASRASFYRETEHTLTEGRSATVVMFDVDGLKDINDALGHAGGDRVLVEIVQRLKDVVRDEGTIARMGADEFAVLIPDQSDIDRARRLAESAAAAIAMPLAIDGVDVRVTACAGVAAAPAHGLEALEVIGAADLAVHKAKQSGSGKTFAFSPALRTEALARRSYHIELQRAVSDSEFVLFYQPQVDLVTGALIGAEALIRWRHPQRGLLSPAAFLPSLERGPLASTVGSWVLDEACAQAAFWRRNGQPDFRMGVNVFGVQFRDHRFASDVLAVLDRHGLPPDALELEITETIALDDDTVLSAIARLRARGVGVAFDDFGTGYASLSLLKTYPITRIKIDRSFVLGMTSSDKDAAVVRAILDMARGFKLQTIGEGIETLEQLDTLRHLGCMEGQGYLFGVPLPAREFADRFISAPQWPSAACA
ncbi:putative bifunctional diguanylate cyclase/phosphodiesterase [Pararobbsia silviterrae]|uniref:EAL domain-containing protein n=1 Tax=Pararobbsia silviterrae TaxID=1792498 RepID=A0A494X8Q4_9BURK|nr:EAL domain-containing protein [Pararobbsia silviterrae]RKP44439.1 EAL domain-containing protein [Pararobbsia silviterrae]